MITITRRQARRLRAVFRRHALGIAHRARCRRWSSSPTRAAASASATTSPPWPSSCALPGRRPGRRSRSPCRWTPWPTSRAATTRPSPSRPPRRAGPSSAGTDRGIPAGPRVRRPRRSPPCRRSPSRPAAFEPCPAVAARRPGRGRRDDRRRTRTRYALGCVAAAGRPPARSPPPTAARSSSRAASACPWAATVLVRRTPLFAARSCRATGPVEVGKTDAHVVLRAGAWTVWLAIRADARFPRVDHAIPDAGGRGHPAAARPGRRRVPGRRAGPPARRRASRTRPVTARPQRPGRRAGPGRGRGPATELVLARSGYTGAAGPALRQPRLPGPGGPARVRRAEVGGPEDPVACRGGRRVYAFQPLSREAAIGPADDAVRIESGPAAPGPAREAGPAPERGPRERANAPPRATAAGRRPGRAPRQPRRRRRPGAADPGGRGAARRPGRRQARAARLIGALRRAAEAVPPAGQHPGPAPGPEAPGGRRVGGPAGARPPAGPRSPCPSRSHPEEARCP